MTVAPDKKFFDTFMLVLGILVGIAVILYILARVVGTGTQVAEVQASDEMRRAINDRIKPVARVAVSGQDNSALEPPKQAAGPAADLGGKEVFDRSCQACHGTNGISSSTRIPNIAGQQPDYLIAQLQAFRGRTRQSGAMQAVAAQLSDEQIAALARYWSGRPAIVARAPAGAA